MKAAFINQHGEAEVLQYGDLPDPVAGPGEVVVDIFAASVNAADWKSRSGGYGLVKFPYVLGRDFSGVANNPQRSWEFEGEPPKAVMKDSGTRDGTL